MSGNMDRKKRIDSLLKCITEHEGKYKHTILDIFSYESGVGLRTLKEYLGVLVSLDKVKLVDTNWAQHPVVELVSAEKVK
ncbi:hypothetical protein ES705_30346 [subsurface metagenome]